MNGVQEGEPTVSQPVQLIKCPHADCGATFTRQWKLVDHETVHSGARPYLCTKEGCGRRFTRRAHLSRHEPQHSGVKQFKCNFENCAKSFYHASRLKRHVGYAHGEKLKYHKCNQPDCSLTFKHRRLFKLHLKLHGMPPKFKCSKDGCGSTFDSHISLKAHLKKHAGYRCPHANCNVLESTWGKLQKHKATHQATFECQVCKKAFKNLMSLRRHKLGHTLHKPTLVCPREECQAYFSTTFNLQHHIRKVHLDLLKHKCTFPDCPRSFAMRESMTRHLLRHDPNATNMKRRQHPKKTWQSRLNGNRQPMVEDNLQRLFSLRMRISRRSKVEANLSGLFKERRIPHSVHPEVNLRNLFHLKRPHEETPQVAPEKQ